MVSYPLPYPIVSHQSPTHGAGGGLGSQCQDPIRRSYVWKGHSTSQVIYAGSDPLGPDTTFDTTHVTVSPGPIKTGPDSRSRTVIRYCNKEIFDALLYNSAISDQEEIYFASSLDNSCLTLPAASHALCVYSSIYKFFKTFFDTPSKLLPSSELRFLFRHHAIPSS